jgi:hypothetical protein
MVRTEAIAAIFIVVFIAFNGFLVAARCPFPMTYASFRAFHPASHVIHRPLHRPLKYLEIIKAEEMRHHFNDMRSLRKRPHAIFQRQLCLKAE